MIRAAQACLPLSTVTVRKSCPVCNDVASIVVPLDSWLRWATGGVYVQDAFPSFTADEREVIVSGTHADCWKKLWPDE